MSVIAVSKQVGSYGEEIALGTAKRLGYQWIGAKEVHELANECDPNFKDACALFEREVPKSFWEKYFLNDSAYMSLFESLNFQLAARGDVVIDGRGAQIVLRSTPGVFKVRIVAPEMIRAERIASEKDMKLDDALSFVHKYDSQRRNLIERIYGRSLSDWALYDLVINTASVSIQAAVDIISDAALKMDPISDADSLKKKLENASLAKKIESAIRKKAASYHGGPEVEIIEDGSAVLTGFVTDRDTKDIVEGIAKSFPEITKVDNQILSIGFGV